MNNKVAFSTIVDGYAKFQMQPDASTSAGATYATFYGDPPPARMTSMNNFHELNRRRKLYITTVNISGLDEEVVDKVYQL